MTTHKIDSYIHQYPGESTHIVLLHGLLTSARYWDPARRRLTAAGYRVSTIDLLGFGQATKVPAESYDYRDHVNHVKNAIHKISGGTPVVLVGHSLGGLISMKLARYHADMISQLVVFNAPLFRDGEQARSSIVGTNPLYSFMMTSKFRAAGWGAARLLGMGMWSRHHPRAREGSLEKVIFRGMGLHDLQKLTVPTTVVTGELDREEYLENLKEISLQDNVDLIVTPTGHHVPAKSPHYVSWVIDKLSGVEHTPESALTEMRVA